jgi:predicted methyltransferase
VHYVGNPYSKNKKRSFIPGIIQRLRTAGFRRIEHVGYNLVIRN